MVFDLNGLPCAKITEHECMKRSFEWAGGQLSTHYIYPTLVWQGTDTELPISLDSLKSAYIAFNWIENAYIPPNPLNTSHWQTRLNKLLQNPPSQPPHSIGHELRLCSRAMLANKWSCLRVCSENSQQEYVMLKPHTEQSGETIACCKGLLPSTAPQRL